MSVFQAVAIEYWTAPTISFHVCHGAGRGGLGRSCNIGTSEWGKSEVMSVQRRLPGSRGLMGLVYRWHTLSAGLLPYFC